jgi:hypothetical protein
MSVLMLSGCGSVDPWSLLPSSERVFLEMGARPQVGAEPISVEELLNRARGDDGAITEEGPNNSSHPRAANLVFSAPEDRLAVGLDASQLDALTPIRDFVTAKPDVTIVIEIPAEPFHSRIAAFRRAAAVARYFDQLGNQVRVLPATDIDPNSLRVSLEIDV